MDIERLVYDNQAEIEVTKEFTFDSCHKLLEYQGACANLHGHTYKLQVTMKGKCDFRGLVIDFNLIKSVVKASIIDVLDHTNLNEVLPFNTTAENMSVWIYNTLREQLKIVASEVKMVEVRLWETPTSFATYKGGK